MCHPSQGRRVYEGSTDQLSILLAQSCELLLRGVLSVFSVCISNVISFPAKHGSKGMYLLSEAFGFGPTILTYQMLHFRLLTWLPSLLFCVPQEHWDPLSSAHQYSPQYHPECPPQRTLNKYLFSEGLRSSLTVQWLGAHVFTTKGADSISGQGTKIPQAMQCSQNNQ